ncbi:HPr kinase/phosphorylase [Candidatus Nucleicultrix amoebiphila]|jgi:serine kinase of HPr protein (carbohydrate metabolism regulator)|uniref:HPr kinase/phosphorylase n=1 Tax=Candidatus Nucleicultrix amoebiphila TaxID=1509244 RepID=UPI000A26A47A|nr:HPr kinase/phosphatase C-terminal domain-containing protein [Candidatus Nucleicultrix amoebiphila]
MKSKLENCIHGNALVYQGRGILILGSPRSGKSDLSLRLIERGAILIADDLVRIEQENGSLVAYADPEFQGLLEVSGVGFIRVQGHSKAILNLVLELGQETEDNRLPRPQKFMRYGVELPQFNFNPWIPSWHARLGVILGNIGLIVNDEDLSQPLLKMKSSQ